MTSYLSKLPLVFCLLLLPIVCLASISTADLVDQSMIFVQITPQFSGQVHREADGSFTVPTGDKELDQWLSSYHCMQLVPVFSFDPISLKNPTFFELGMDRFYLVQGKVDPDKPFGNETVDDVVNGAKTLSVIALAEPVNHRELHATPNDWSVAAGTSGMWGLDGMRCREAWEMVRGSSSILIASIDTGVNYDHPDLIPNIRVNTTEDINHDGRFTSADLNGIDDDHNGFIDDVIGYDFTSYVPSGSWTATPGEEYGPRDPTPSDFNGHGTHVCGTMAAATKNTIGVPAASYNVSTICIRAGGSVTKPDGVAGLMFGEDTPVAIQYAVNRGARIISGSYGGGIPNTAEHTAIQYARANNCLCFFSAGNDNSSTMAYPAAFDESQAVASLAPGNVKSSFSNYGGWIDFCAPGSSILSTSRTGGYEIKSGTSMASPNAASVAALILSSRPSISDDSLLTLFQRYNSDIIAFDPNNAAWMGKMVDAYSLVRNAYPVTLNSPRGGERILSASSLRITWNAREEVSNIMIEMNQNYPSGAWEPVAGPIVSIFDYIWATNIAPTTTLRFRVYDQNNPASFDMSTSNITIYNNTGLPFRETFASTTFPPTSWTSQPVNTNYMYWTRYTGEYSGDGCLTVRSPGDESSLITPPLNTLSLASATLNYDWSCAPESYETSLPDTLEVFYCYSPTDTKYTLNKKWTRGTGEHALISFENAPPYHPFPGMWNTMQISLPNEILNRPTIYFGLRINRGSAMGYGTDPGIFVDNFTILPGVDLSGPTNLSATQLSAASLQFTWIDHSFTEQHFTLFKSVDGTQFEPLDSVNANVLAYTATNLTPNTRYWFRVYAWNGISYSQTFAETDLNLPAVIPFVPTVYEVSQYRMTINPENNATTPNNVETEYAIRCDDNFVNWIQADGTFGTEPVWQRLTGWNQIFIENLVPNTPYQIFSVARDRSGSVTEYSPRVTRRTETSYSPPYMETFPGPYALPYSWQRANPEGGVLWQRFADYNANDGVAELPISSSIPNGEHAIFWTPHFDFRPVGGYYLRFIWSYTFNESSTNDSLIVVTDRQGTQDQMWIADANGYSGLSLAAGSGGMRSVPGETGTWGHARVFIPAQALEQDYVRIGFIGINHGGSNIYIDSVYISQILPTGSPANATLIGTTTSSTCISWVDQSDEESGFVIDISFDGYNFSPHDTVSENVTSASIQNLPSSTYIYYRVYSLVSDVRSVGYASANGWTLAEAPLFPLVTAVGCSTLRIVPVIGTTAPPSTFLSFRELSTGLWIQPPFGVLDTSEIRLPYNLWDTIKVVGLTPGITYQFACYAYNGDYLRSDPSPDCWITTYIPVALPLTESFEQATFPPSEWFLDNQGNEITWDRISGGYAGDGVARLDWYHNGFLGEKDILWTPFLTMPSIEQGGTVSFTWTYAPYQPYVDTLQIVTMNQDGYLYPLQTLWSSAGTLDNSLNSGDGSAMVPGIESSARTLTLPIPNEVLSTYARIGLIGINGHGSILFVNSLHVTGPVVAPPAAPQQLQIRTSGTFRILEWNAVSGATAGYHVYRSSTPYFTPPVGGTLIYSVPAGTQQYIEEPTGRVYYYRVTAVN